MGYLANDNNEAKFNGVLLTSVPGLTVLATNPYLPPRPNLTIDEIARRSKQTVSSQFYNNKQITIKVAINTISRSLTEQSRDILFGLLHGREKDLILKHSGALRKWTATYADYNFVQQGGSYMEIDLLFKCSDQYGYDINPSTLLSVINTSASRASLLSVDGNAPTQLPIITLTYTAADVASATSINILVGNNSTGQQIAITGSSFAGGVATYIIDCANQTVTKDGTDIMSVVSGAFPEFAKGENYQTYSDNIASRTVHIFTQYYKRNF